MTSFNSYVGRAIIVIGFGAFLAIVLAGIVMLEFAYRQYRSGRIGLDPVRWLVRTFAGLILVAHFYAFARME